MSSCTQAQNISRGKKCPNTFKSKNISGEKCPNTLSLYATKVTNQFYWKKSFSNNAMGCMICLFNETIKTILANYILYGSIICDDRDPPWLNKILDKFEKANM